ncbi:hypothetical protein NXY34_03480 [Bacteroides fragilis]|nr:hypothetical protein [Bacteroides fragilis]
MKKTGFLLKRINSFYYFYLSFHNQRGAPLRPAAAHVETENTGQADAEGSLTERNTENVKLLRGLRRTALLVLPAALPGMNL